MENPGLMRVEKQGVPFCGVLLLDLAGSLGSLKESLDCFGLLVYRESNHTFGVL